MMQSKMPSRRAQRRRLVLCVTAGVMLAGNLALATTYTWTRAANNNNWDSVTGGTTSNWATTGAINVPPPQTPASGDTTDLVYAGTVTFSGTSSSMRQDYTVDSITLAADFWHGAQATFNINTPSTLLAGATSAHLTIGAGGITSEIGNGVGTYNVSITRNALLTGDLILGADQTWKTNAPVPAPGGSAITFTINRPIVGDKTVTKSGTGVLVLQMTNGQNTGFTGTLVLQQGSIRTGGFDTSPNTHFGSAVLVANNPDDFTITASTVNTEGGERNFDNDLILRGGAGRLIFGGSFGLNFNAASTWTLETDKQIGSSIYTIHRGSITGNHGWTKTNGGMMILQGASDYTGITTVADGVLQPQHNSALGTTDGGTVVSTGGALELTGQSILDESLSIAGLGEGTANSLSGTLAFASIQANAGALRNRSGSSTWSGTVTVTAPDTYVAVDTGELNLSGGVFSGGGPNSIRVGGAGLLRAARLRLEGIRLDAGSRVAISPDGTSSGRSNFGTIDFAGGVVAPTAQLDIDNNALVIQGHAVPIADVEALILAGRAGGSWNGNGIASSAAAGNPNGAIGYALASEVAVAPIFGAVVSDAVLARYTINGDANLDGTVNIGDFSLLAANFNQPGRWSKGDFNYDGSVNIGDFSLLAANFNQVVSADSPRGAVPEPASWTALAIGAAALARRWRRG